MTYSALYLHIPFCKAKCAYCDFDSRALGGCELERAMDAYCARLLTLVDRHGAAGELDRVRTVYIGGGTPSLLGDRLPQVVRRVRSYCSPIEFTCEANPESFDMDLAQALRDAGVTRVSLGVQSLDTGELRAIGRIHTAEQAMLAIAQAKAVGFSTSCDVICGLPGQTVESFSRTLESLLALRPDHVSVYPLQLEEGTPLARMEEDGLVQVPDEDFQAACMDLAARALSAAGFERYEVASYAQPGHRCRHNIAYWTGMPYLGLGRSAAGMFDVGCGLAVAASPPACAPEGFADLVPAGFTGRVRFKQLDDAGERFESELLAPREAMAEDLMLACRMTDGIGIGLLKRACALIPEHELRAACEAAVRSGLAAWDGRALVPTHLGWLEGNELFCLLWALAG